MKKIMMAMAAMLGICGCTIDANSITSGVSAVKTIFDLLKQFGILACVALALTFNVGCQQMYPKFMDSPEFQQAAIQAFSESAKTMSGNANLSNPEMEFYYKVSVGGRVIGLTANVQGSGTTTGRTTTQPAEK